MRIPIADLRDLVKKVGEELQAGVQEWHALGLSAENEVEITFTAEVIYESQALESVVETVEAGENSETTVRPTKITASDGGIETTTVAGGSTTVTDAAVSQVVTESGFSEVSTEAAHTDTSTTTRASETDTLNGGADTTDTDNTWDEY